MEFVVKGKNVLDIGCRTPYLKDQVQMKGMEYRAVDIDPSEGVEYGDIHKLPYKDNSFDYVICSEVLEHVENPIKAMQELKRVTKKRLIITVPNEPFFTLFRFLIWEQGHLWAITPSALRVYLGEPAQEKTYLLKRYYLGVWDFKK